MVRGRSWKRCTSASLPPRSCIGLNPPTTFLQAPWRRWKSRFSGPRTSAPFDLFDLLPTYLEPSVGLAGGGGGGGGRQKFGATGAISSGGVLSSGGDRAVGG